LEPERQIVNLGDNPVVMCTATGQQPIQLTWSREDGRPLSPLVAQMGGRLQFSRISAADQGRYVCTARNADAEATSTAEVMVNDYNNPGRDEIAEPERISASEGASVDLPCRLDPGSRVQWRREGGRGVLPSTATQRGMSLSMVQLTSQDSGLYTCYGPRGSMSVELRVERMRRIRKPVVSVNPSLAMPYVTGSLDISCDLEGDVPDTYSLSWTRVGSELPVNAITRDKLIRFINLSMSDQGLYRCVAETPEGTFYSDYNLMLSMAGQGMG